MKKGIFIFLLSFCACADSFAVNNFKPQKFNTITSHADVYPYVLNYAQSGTTANNISNTGSVSARRAVVPRSKKIVRAASTNTSSQPRRVVQRSNNARVATNTAPIRNNVNVNRNVNARAASPVRANVVNVATTNTSSNERVSSQRCMADYKECMEGYCKREDTAYNRCYCSAKLAQIDAKYQNKIDELIQQIVRLRYNTSTATSDEIKEYWDQTVGVYTHDNPWVNIDNALNIEWADTQSRIRGQNAFNTGHQYCTQHLRACYYMASNLRDAYKSEIARDCETYEKSLRKIQDAAESVIESYHD